MQSLVLHLPADIIIPTLWHGLQPAEQAFVITTGCDLIAQARTKVATLSQEELLAKWKQQSAAELQRLEAALSLEKQKTRDYLEDNKLFYEQQQARLQQQLIEARAECAKLQQDVQQQVRDQVAKECERYRTQLDERSNQVLRITEKYESFLAQMQQQQLQAAANATKSSKQLGDEGEEAAAQQFVHTFRDFAGFRMEKKAHQAHRGDFHLFFREFNVLVDLKNYTGSVQKKELEKIEQDLALNETMDFAWLISLQSSVSDWNRFPIMFKWVVTETRSKCIVIVNHFHTAAGMQPERMLRNLWSTTLEIHRIVGTMGGGRGGEQEDAAHQLEQLKERDLMVIQQLKLSQKRLQEMKKALVHMTQTTRDLETDMTEGLDLLTRGKLVQLLDKQQLVAAWWRQSVTFLGPDLSGKPNAKVLTSTDVWARFRKDNKGWVDQQEMTVDVFKQLLKQVVPPDQVVEKTRNGLLEFPWSAWSAQGPPTTTIDLEFR